MALIGRVVAMTGVAYLITDNGAKRELQLGDQIQIGDTIQTLRGVEVDLELASGRVIHISAEQLVAFTEELSEVIAPSNLDSAINLATIDTVIKAIEEGKDVSEVLEETAAGSGGQSNSYGFGFVDLLRINDILNAFKFAYEYETGGRVDADTSVVNDSNALIIDQGNLGAGTVASINAPPVATPLAIGRDEGTGSYTGALTATDANGDTLTYSPTGVLPAGLVLNPDGSFTFDYSNPAYDYLAAGVPQVLVVPYLVSDGKGVTSSSTLTITVNGSNDVATLTSDSKALTETNSALSTGGTLVLTDLDATAATVVADSISTSYGTFTVDAAGAWTYNTVSALNQLNAGQVITETFNVATTDGGTASVTVTITGSNDVPVISADSFAVKEGSVTVLGNVLANDTDVDSPALTAGQFATNTSGTGATAANGTNSITTALGGTVVMNADGTFTYTAPVRNHADAVSDIDSFAYRASDGTAVSAWTTVSINLTDTAPIANDDIDSLGGNASITGNVIAGMGVGGADVLGADAVSITNVAITQGTLISSTVDAGNMRTIVTANGTLVIDQNGGGYTYTANPITKTVAAGTNSANQSVWTAAGINTYGYDNVGGNFADPYVNGTPDSGIKPAALNGIQQGIVSYRNNNNTDSDGIGVEGGKGSSGIEVGESLLLDLGMSTNSAKVTITALGVSKSVAEVATWYAFAADGSYVATGTGTVNGSNSNVASVTISPGVSFAYLIFTTNDTNTSYRIDGLTATSVITVPDIFTYTLTDADGSASSATLTINPGLAPVIDLDASGAGTGFAATFTQNGAAVSIADTDISITDADSTSITKATITLTNDQAGDVLAAGSMPAGITATVAGNVITLTGSATLASYQTAIRAITFSTVSTDATPRTIDVVVTDGVNYSNTATATVAVVISAPAIDLDASAAGTGFATNYLAGGVAASIADTDIKITDLDSTNLAGATITLTNAQAGDMLIAGAMPAGIAASVTGNVVTLTGSATLADYQAAIRAVTFANTGAAPNETTRMINVVVTDGAHNSNTATASIAIVPTGSNNTGFEDVASIPVTLTHPVTGDAAASFSLSSLPANGALYLDAAMTILVTTGTDLSTNGSGFLTLYFKPMADFNSGAFAGLGVPSFDFTAKNGLGVVSPVATETITVTAVDDGAPSVVNDSFTTAFGSAPITFTGAQLLANDTLFDHARITATGALPAGLTYNAGTDTYTYTPVAAGAASFTYTVTDDEGQTSTATVNLTTLNAGTDLATVNESALVDGTGGGTRVVTGNLFANDVGNTSISTINNIVPVSGYITVTTAYGTLVVNSTGAGAGDYTYTLNNKVDNDTQAGADTNGYVETFTYKGNAATADLVVTIKDDVPTAQNNIVTVPQTSTLTNYNLVLMLDVSGSMTTTNAGGDVRIVDANGNATISTRLAASKQAMIDMVTKYFDESASVTVKVGYFSGSATAGTVLLTTKADAIAAINAIPATGGGTNYEDALYKIEDMFGTVDTAKTNISYFISDGVPTSGNTTAPASATNGTYPVSYAQYLANNPTVKSYAIGIGGGISNTMPLDSIHNVDADANNVVDPAILVNDLNGLSSALTATIPPSFGGNVGTSGNNAFVKIGADGGFVQNIDMLLDSNDAGTVPDMIVRFAYNPATNQITYDNFYQTGVHSTVTVAGDLLTLNAALGFTKGTLVFNFSNGDYSYYTQGAALSGDQIDIAYSLKDNDGDIASAVETIKIVNGIPVAHDDRDTLLPKNTFFDGNVINATSTDGANQAVSVFSVGAGTDNAVDNAVVTSIVFNGATFNLSTPSSGTLGGGTYTVNAAKELTWTNSTNPANVLIFHSDGYYKYTPPAAQTSGPTQGAQQTISFDTNPSGSGITLQGVTRLGNVNAPDGTIDYSSTGVGVTGGGASNRVDNLETLIINFNRANYAQGVQNVSLNINTGSNLAAGSAVAVSVFDILGNLLGQVAITTEGLVALPTNWSNVGSIHIEPNSNAQVLIDDVRFNLVNLDTTSTNIPDTVIGYTLTDAQGDTSSANLTLHIVENEIQGTVGVDTITGTAANDAIAGFDGNDIINGGAGSDIVKGGAGDDSIDGGADDDQLYGGDGNDTIIGGTGNDLISGDAGNDNLQGGDGSDVIRGGTGNDVIDGGIGNDIIIGGAGTDMLTGGAGVDVFKWELADKGIKGTPATDTIADFNISPAASGGDVLDLRDLLVGENHDIGAGNLASYIHFEKSGSDTIVHVSSNGEFAAGFNAAKDVQTIMLTNVDLVGSFSNDQQIVADLLSKQKLVTD